MGLERELPSTGARRQEMPANTLELRERTTTSVQEETFHRLQGSRRAKQLLQDGVISFINSRTTPFGVRCGCYVGQALLESGFRLIIHEKDAGALRNLLHYSVPEDVRESQLPSPVASESELLILFAERFLEHLGYYLRHGRLKIYDSELRKTNSPRGRIDLGRTMRSSARGDAVSISCWVPQLTGDILPNRLLALGLLAVESLFGASKNEQVLDLTRMYAPLFSDVLNRQQLSQKQASIAFDQAFQSSRVVSDLRHALLYARALVLNLGAWPDINVGYAEVPHSFFINLETLYENAIRTALSESLPASFQTSKGSRLNCPTFVSLPDRYVADPDLVVLKDNSPVFVGDCKYKVIDGYPGHSDIYQLLSHSNSIHCKTAALVYPGNKFSLMEVGVTGDGVTAYMFQVRTNALHEDVPQISSLIQSKAI